MTTSHTAGAHPIPRWGNVDRNHKALAIWQTLARHEGARIADAQWLDVGCGSGGIAAALAPRVKKIIAVDPEPWPNWAEASSNLSNLDFRVGRFDNDELPIPESSVDIAVCNQVYEHVANSRRLVANLNRVLKPGGVCYFAGPNLLWPIEPHVFWPFVHWLPRIFAQRLMRVLGSKRADELDAFPLSYWALTRLFREMGFAYRGGVLARISAELNLRGFSVLSAIVAKLPVALLRPLSPFSPGFIFILHKTNALPDGSGI